MPELNTVLLVTHPNPVPHAQRGGGSTVDPMKYLMLTVAIVMATVVVLFVLGGAPAVLTLVAVIRELTELVKAMRG